MKKLSNILKESVWSDMHRRSNGEQIKKEDSGAVVTIDGVKYFITKDVMSMGEDYEKNNNTTWTVLAFDKPSDGKNIISPDNNCEFTENGDYGMDSEHDIYMLRDYINKPLEEITNEIIKNGDFDDINDEDIEIKNILIDYCGKIFKDNHMSEFAKYYICDLSISDWFKDYGAIWVYNGTDICEDDLDDEFPGKTIVSANSITYANFKDWSDELRRDLIEAYERLGWTKSNADPIDPYDGPRNTNAIIFVKFE